MEKKYIQIAYGIKCEIEEFITLLEQTPMTLDERMKFLSVIKRIDEYSDLIV